MRALTMAMTGLLIAGMAMAATQTPEKAWQDGIKEANLDWAKVPHAILKIQDAAYLGEGQSATLTGTKGKPDTFKWVSGKKPGVLFAGFSRRQAHRRERRQDHRRCDEAEEHPRSMRMWTSPAIPPR